MPESLDLESSTGARPILQKRSVALQTRFLEAGAKLLKTQRLSDMRIPDLAKAAKSSIGGFYSRFENKEGFFACLQHQMGFENTLRTNRVLSLPRLQQLSTAEIIADLVSVMSESFFGKWKGVMRESYAAITTNPAQWGPMRARGRAIADQLTTVLAPRLDSSRTGIPPEDAVHFVANIVYSTMINRLMNPLAAAEFSDKHLNKNLVTMIIRYLGEEKRGQSMRGPKAK